MAKVLFWCTFDVICIIARRGIINNCIIIVNKFMKQSLQNSVVQECSSTAVVMIAFHTLFHI